MRTRKARGKKPAVITLEEQDILTACRRYLEEQGHHDLGAIVWIKSFKSSEDKSGRRRRSLIEIEFEKSSLLMEKY